MRKFLFLFNVKIPEFLTTQPLLFFNTDRIEKEFNALQKIYDKYKKTHKFKTLSMGMSGDYKIAIKNGSNMVRLGSVIFGSRS